MPPALCLVVVVQVEREVAQKLLQRRCVGVHADEDEPVVCVQRRRGEQCLALALEPVLAAVGLLVEWQTDDPAVVTVGPAVVRAAEVRRVAHLGPAHLHPAVQTHVEHRPDLPFLITGDDERVLKHAAHDVVAGLRHLGLMGHEEPAAAEQPLLLQDEDLVVVVDVRRDHAPADVLENMAQIGHRLISHVGELLAVISVLQRSTPTQRGSRVDGRPVKWVAASVPHGSAFRTLPPAAPRCLRGAGVRRTAPSSRKHSPPVRPGPEDGGARAPPGWLTRKGTRTKG